MLSWYRFMDDVKKIVRLGYNQCAKNYTENRDLFKNQKYLDEMVAKLPKKAEVLDVGCGSGVPVDKYLTEHQMRVTGVDISEKQIELARQNVPTGKFMVGDMAEMDFLPNSFDGVVSFYAIFHIPRDEHLFLFKKIYLMLRAGGYILVTMGASDWIGTEDDFHGVKMFWSHYGAEKNVEIIKTAGFEIVSEEIDTSGGEKHLVILAKKRK